MHNIPDDDSDRAPSCVGAAVQEKEKSQRSYKSSGYQYPIYQGYQQVPQQQFYGQWPGQQQQQPQHQQQYRPKRQKLNAQAGHQLCKVNKGLVF